MVSKLNICILPAGAWGTALAVPLSDNGHRVKLYFRQNIDSRNFNKTKINSKRLPEIKFNGLLSSTSNIKEAVSGSDILVLACDSVHIRSQFIKIKPFLNEKTIVLCITKGIEEGTNMCMFQVLEDIKPEAGLRFAVMSGPNFAVEVGQRFPAMTVIASKNHKVAELLQKTFSSENFRVYTQDDVIGVGLGGALKNVIAIGVGIGDGLKMGENGRAALITRGIAEMVKLGVTMGADKLTFAGLSGMGDLILTCTSGKSRNHQAGLRIGKGEDLQKLLKSRETIEGLHTVKSAYQLAKKKNLNLPIMETVYKIVYKNLDPKIGFKQLMKLELSSEDGD